MNIVSSPLKRHDAPEEAACSPRRIVTPLACGLFMMICALLVLQPRQAKADGSFTAQADTTYTHTAYLPILLQSPPWRDISTRQASRDYYTNVYMASEGISMGWTGNLDSCTPGTTSVAYRTAVLQRVNYYRTMAGVPGVISLNDTYNQKAQAAALMMSRNNALNHTPPSNWQCYSADGAAGAGSSNLALGVSGPGAINLFMRDNGSTNTAAGHRRWVLYPQTQQMGTGDIPSSAGHSPANALVVFDSHGGDARPATREPYVAWPPPGYVPYPVVYARWSFAYAGADFSSATVSMSRGVTNLSVAKSTPQNGYGENTLVWIPMGLNDGASWPKPAADTVYHVTVNNVIISGTPHNFNYDVTIFDPAT